MTASGVRSRNEAILCNKYLNRSKSPRHRHHNQESREVPSRYIQVRHPNIMENHRMVSKVVVKDESAAVEQADENNEVAQTDENNIVDGKKEGKSPGSQDQDDLSSKEGIKSNASAIITSDKKSTSDGLASVPPVKSFPEKLYEIVSDPDVDDVIGWLPHGRGFLIHDKIRFAKEVLPQHFEGTKYTR
eukprot:scaffold46775_cov70-Cyclotella_meneghiniana.AAC.9